jgi:hypothetical protein
MLAAEVIRPVEDIEAIVVAPYLNNNTPPDSTIEKLVVAKGLAPIFTDPVPFGVRVRLMSASEPVAAKNGEAPAIAPLAEM